MTGMDRLDGTLDEQYGALWSGDGGGPEPSVIDYLADHPDASPSERLDVILADQLLRWLSGRPKAVGDYLAEHPLLADDPEAILRLIQGEFLARLGRGEEPEPSSYARMFPALAQEIMRQYEVDRWLTAPEPPGPSMSMPTTAEYRTGGAGRIVEDATDDGGRPAQAAGRPGDPEAPLPWADFELVRRLGSGGMGEVYEAIQKSLRKRVALKLIRPEALDSATRVRRFFAEARALARLRHPNIVGVHGIGRMADGRYFLVMDLIEGETTLATLLRRGPLPFGLVADLVATVAEAIEHAHSRGVIHRDLKPSNVLLGAEGRPHVTDFGLAKVFDAADPDDPQTPADQILGTPHYMAPEQADPARGPVTPRTDVYALGGLLYALLTGRPPIEGDSLTAVLTRVISLDPVPSPRDLRGDVPTALERICRNCLEKHASERCPSAGAVAGALCAWLAHAAAVDSAAATADLREQPTSSNQDPDTVRARSSWAPDRSLKDGRRKPTPGRWPAKAALPSEPRRRTRVAMASLSILALLFLAVTLVQIRRRPPVVVGSGYTDSDRSSGSIRGVVVSERSSGTNRDVGPPPKPIDEAFQGQPDAEDHGAPPGSISGGDRQHAEAITFGSTPQGDYLRGVGIADRGMDPYYLTMAQPSQTSLQTFIMLNEDIWASYKAEMKENAEYRVAMRARDAEAYRTLMERIHDRPERFDSTEGDALNFVLRDLLNSQVSDSVARYAKVPLDAAVIRHIPFKLGEKGETFSMGRLSLRGIRGVAFQDPSFAPYVDKYQRTVDAALELAMEGKMTEQAIQDIERTFSQLDVMVRRSPDLLNPDHLRDFYEAKEQLDKMRRTPRLFMMDVLQPIFREIDTYTGTTVDDLRRFMQRHNLSFAPAETATERWLYPQLHAALREQRKKSTGEG